MVALTKKSFSHKHFELQIPNAGIFGAKRPGPSPEISDGGANFSNCHREVIVLNISTKVNCKHLLRLHLFIFQQK